jgi:tRNA-specific 2-thiouridylase
MRKDVRGSTVFVGLSGGVDSSVAALRLKNAGYRVVGVFIKVWQPDFLTCNWEAERLDAMRVAATLDIPFLTCDATDRYKNDVADYLIREYKAGRTPNPDVMCNKHVKFGAFLDFARAHGADFVATGHYAQRIDKDSGPELHRGADQNKDQSYFLWTLTNEQLSQIVFPVGNSEKAVIRKEAEHAGLPTAEKPDSQGVCFLGALDMKEFLFHFIPRDVGTVRDTDGNEIGEHDGALFYTIGQRHGFRNNNTHADDRPYYVVEKDIEKNILVASHKKPTHMDGHGSTLYLTDTNWIGPRDGEAVEIQTRYRQKPARGIVSSAGDARAEIKLSEPLEMSAAGQSCVLYRGTRCLGGGIIDRVDS